MKKCPSCNIQLDGDRTNCPFCQNSLIGDASEANWPPINRLKKQAFFFRLQLFIVLVIIVISVSLDFLLKLNNGVHYSLLVSMWGLTTELLLRFIIKRHVFPSKIISFSVVTGSVLLAVTAYYLNFFTPVFYIVIPIVISATIIANFVFSFIDKRGNDLIYLICTIFVGLVPYIVLEIGHKDMLIAWNVCWMISIIAALGIIVFKGRKVLTELQKRFNI